mgnify:CR=1 FL=1
MKHSKATRANISVEQMIDKIVVKIEDNGKGFDLSENKSSSSMGLHSIISRAEMIGYHAEIISKNDFGTNRN